MSRKYTAPVRTPTRDVSGNDNASSSPLSKGAITGIAVGAGVLVIAIIVGIWLCCRRRAKTREVQQTPPAMLSVVPTDSHTPSGIGSMWSPGSSHNTPDTLVAYVNGNVPVYMRQQSSAGSAVIPNQPFEMPGHIHDCGANEIYDDRIPTSAVSMAHSPGGEAIVSPYSAGADAIKYGSNSWPSPVRGIQHTDHLVYRNDVDVYASGGYGPQELSTDPSGDQGSVDGRRHQTFYHR